MKLQFPTVEDEKSLEDNEFNVGIHVAHKKIQSDDFSSAECINAINQFIRTGKNQICADVSTIDILSCFDYLYYAICGIMDTTSG